MHVVATAVQAASGPVQCQLQSRTTKDSTLLGHLQLMRLASVVESGGAVDHETHPATDAPQHPDQPMTVAGSAAVLDRHEVDHLADPVGGHEPGDQDGGVGEVELPDHPVGTVGGDAEASALIPVEQAGEDTWSVKAGTAEPVDTAVGADQRRGLKIADQSVLGNGRVRLHGCSS